MRIVSLTKSYPSAGSPVAGTFIRSRAKALARSADVRVLHAVPFFRPRPGDEPSGRPRVRRTRYCYLPGILKGLDHRFLARSVRPVLDQWHRAEPFDVLAAELGYPEGAAAVDLGARYGVPVAVTLRGTELDFAGTGARGRAMANAIRRADLVIAVCRDLAELARESGAREDRIRVIRNGVDTARFRPQRQEEARRRLGLSADGRWLLSVGLLVRRKGHDLAIAALGALAKSHPDLRLAIVGGGPEERRLKRQAERLGVGGRVRFAGLVPPDEVPQWFSAADLLVLASRREGLANVLLESLASGLPVVTTDVGGAREVVTGPALGRVVPAGDGTVLTAAIRVALAESFGRDAIRARARTGSWEESGARVVEAFRDLLARR